MDVIYSKTVILGDGSAIFVVSSFIVIFRCWKKTSSTPTTRLCVLIIGDSRREEERSCVRMERERDRGRINLSVTCRFNCECVCVRVCLVCICVGELPGKHRGLWEDERVEDERVWTTFAWFMAWAGTAALHLPSHQKIYSSCTVGTTTPSCFLDQAKAGLSISTGFLC